MPAAKPERLRRVIVGQLNGPRLVDEGPGQCAQRLLDGAHTDFLDQRQTGLERMHTEHVRAATLKTCCRLADLPVLAVVVAGMLQHVPTVLSHGQLLAQNRPAVEHRQTLWAKHPFMAVGNDKIGVIGGKVKGHRAQALNRIDTKQDPSVTSTARKTPNRR